MIVYDRLRFAMSKASRVAKVVDLKMLLVTCNCYLR